MSSLPQTAFTRSNWRKRLAWRTVISSTFFSNGFHEVALVARERSRTSRIP